MSQNNNQMLDQAAAAVSQEQVTCQAIKDSPMGPVLCGAPVVAVWNITLAGEIERTESAVIHVTEAPAVRHVVLAVPLCEQCDINPLKFGIGVNRIPLGALVDAAGRPTIDKNKKGR